MSLIRKKRIISTFIFTLFLSSCGEPTKGGDHVGDDAIYELTYELNESTRRFSDITPRENSLAFLQRYVHINDYYNVCLYSDSFSEDEISEFEAYIVRETEDRQKYGLQAILELTFTSLKTYFTDREKFSSRIEFNIIRTPSPDCDVFMQKQNTFAFPFNHEDFVNAEFKLFYANQLRDVNGTSNRIPVFFVVDSLDPEALNPVLQIGLAQYLGLGESSDDASYLNPEAVTKAGELMWDGFDGDRTVDEDEIILFSFAGVFQELLTPSELDRAHHHLDRVFGQYEELDEDPDLEALPGTENITFNELIGNSYLKGVRGVSNKVNICFENKSDTAVAVEIYEEMLNGLAYFDAGSLAYYVNQIEESITIEYQLSTEACQLRVVLKNDTQYPFTKYQLNGVYVHEESLRIGDAPTPIPIIYLNLSNLSLEGESTKKDMKLVLRHELAHFLGFKHSLSKTSLLSPAGYNSKWDTTGYDQEMFVEYADQFIQFKTN